MNNLINQPQLRYCKFLRVNYSTKQKIFDKIKFGGAGLDRAWSVVSTSDGGYIVAGYTRSFGAGGADFLVVKINSDGSMAPDCPWTACSPTITNPSVGAGCSPTVTFPTLSTLDVCTPGVEEENVSIKVKEPSLKVYPNPSFGKAMVKYCLPKTADVRLVLYDIYFIRLEAPDFTLSSKLTVLK